MNDKQITITDDHGKELIFNILFTFENENNKYVLCYDESDEESIIPFKYDDEGNAFIVEDENELDIIEEFLESYDKKGGNNEKHN